MTPLCPHCHGLLAMLCIDLHERLHHMSWYDELGCWRLSSRRLEETSTPRLSCPHCYQPLTHAVWRIVPDGSFREIFVYESKSAFMEALL